MSTIRNSSFYVRLPILLAVTLAGGIFLGAKVGGNSNNGNVAKSYQKYREILSLIDRDYVDTVNIEKLVDYSIEKMLEKLDPHTAYIPASDIQMARAQLESDFDGIGVEFNIFRDTVSVIAPLAGGPSESAGIRAGDKIVEANGVKLTGKSLDNNLVFTSLRGPRGSKVKIGIVRKGVKEVVYFNITRDKIPQFSIESSHMVDNATGYIKVSRFAANTYDEFKKALGNLKKQGMQQLVLDLRGNPGGYMDRATNMVDELLAGNKLIVYTDGKESRYDQKVNASQPGIFEKGPIIVLLDEGSASASEIVAGALQDNDRALVVGRRSFGKGLVQAPIPLEDGSELRLTISRYYTPSGRSIQKEYTHDGTDDYDRDIEKRYEHGEFFNADSIKFNTSKTYKTAKGRTVYGGGGIMPDVFVSLDTNYNTKYLAELYNSNIVREYALNYATDHRKELDKMSFADFRKKVTITDAMLQDVIKMANQANITYNDKDFQRSKAFLSNQLKALIARTVWRRSEKDGLNNEYYQITLEQDPVFQKALQSFPKAAALEQGKLASSK
ncbi:S41 family peptidase [Cytophagaceae bacterium DM2B3-1]|uniref:S41 family peptidase n=1 Tax=Xanthocytophaga flava TaxID=3048013 RepID=A0AAE3QXV8_9BACT|nr:S41 family peptidase [Xanthocytophaga flavus]MDJ1471373.1 S41 family peptidase [Xanthocytophaga flavus]MDJ1484764.1 S41 family peptidase [Xanthocytophaga flavus]MDJ1496749.1 S41 family peptidase [Xanthocytophaga flavus]